MASKACDTCKSAADSSFKCLRCDSTIYSDNNKKLVSSRVWMCEVCEQTPAAFTCKADAAAICVTCDADIHSANPLAHHHHRVPVPTFLNSQQDVVMGSWLFPSPTLLETNHIKTGDLVFSKVAMDSVVPVQIKPAIIPVVNDENSFHIDFAPHKLPTFSFQSQSLGHSVSSSSVEVGVVPDGNSLSDMSYPLGRALTDSSNNQAAEVSGMDREARILRHREKREKIKFEKTVRYASRKAYAESRPRIKGRFVKRTQIHNQVDHMYNSAAVAFTSHKHYGVVPSFVG